MTLLRKLTGKDFDDLVQYLKVSIKGDTRVLFKEKLLASQSAETDLSVFKKFPDVIVKHYMDKHYETEWMKQAETKYKEKLMDMEVLETNIHRGLSPQKREVKIKLAKQTLLNDLYKSHIKHISEGKSEDMTDREQIFLKYMAKNSRGPIPNYETVWKKKPSLCVKESLP